MNMYLEDIKLTVFILLVGLFVIVFLSSVQVVVAQVDSSIIFTEIMYDLEGGDDGYEWVEIYNGSDIDYVIDSNWRFYDGSNHVVNVFSGDGILSAGETIIIVDNVENYILANPDYVGDLLDSVVKLNNTGETLKLSLDSGDAWVTEVEYLSSVGASGDGNTLEYNGDAWQQSLVIGGSPGVYLVNNEEIEYCDCDSCNVVDIISDDEEVAESIEEEIEEIVEEEIVDNGSTSTTSQEVVEVAYSDEVIINELIPDPAGSDEEDEYIELFNKGLESIDLTGWYLIDASDKKFELVGNINEQEYLVVYRTESKITLNNSAGDSVRLLNPIDEVVSEVNYSESVSSESYSYIDSEWQWTDQLTPGMINEKSFIPETIDEEVIVENVEEKVDDVIKELKLISEIKNLDKDTEVYVRGIVTALPGQFADTYFYVSEIDFDGEINLSTGIQIYSSKKYFPDLEIGEVIVIFGKLSETNGEKRIKVLSEDDIQVIESHDLPQPEEVLTGEISDDYEGGFIYVQADLIDKKSTSWYLDDDSGEIRVYISPKTGIEKPTVELGQKVLVIGVVSETKSGFRLLPRLSEDIVVEKTILEEDEPEVTVIVKPTNKYINVGESSDEEKGDFVGYGLGVVSLTMASWALKLKFL